jgi:hypothetical protein
LLSFVKKAKTGLRKKVKTLKAKFIKAQKVEK